MRRAVEGHSIRRQTVGIFRFVESWRTDGQTSFGMLTFSELKYEAVIVQVAADFRRINQLLHDYAVKLLFSPDSGQH